MTTHDHTAVPAPNAAPPHVPRPATPHDDGGEGLLGRVPRHDLVAEQSVLGALMLSPDALDEITGLLNSADFYRPAHQLLFETITDLARRGEPHDAVAVLAALGDRGLLDRVGGAPYVHTVLAAPPTAANGVYYARLVKKDARMRALVATGTALIQMGTTGDPDLIDEHVARAHERLITLDQAVQDPPTFGTALMGMLEKIEHGEDTTGRVQAPYADLEAVLQGFRPGQLVTIGARPGMGKSVLAVDIARDAALRQGLPAFVASVEMTREEIMQRIVAAETRVALSRLRAGNLEDAEWDRIAALADRVADAPLIIDDSPTVTPDTLRASLRRMQRRTDVDAARILVVDYLQLMKSTSRAENRQVEVSELSRNLKLIAREFEIPVIMLAQLNRGPEARLDKVPAVSDLRESGSIEQDSDVVILIHREDAYDKLSPRAGEADLIIGKHRNGPTTVVTLAFQGHYSRFTNMARMD